MTAWAVFTLVAGLHALAVPATTAPAIAAGPYAVTGAAPARARQARPTEEPGALDGAAPAAPPQAAPPAASLPPSHSLTGAALDAAVARVASRLRCPVCQQLSVEQSRAELAARIRGVIRDRLAAGQSEQQVIAYFVSKYGQWILLDPPKRGVNLVVWLGPLAALFGGGALLAAVFRRWLRAHPGDGEIAEEPDDGAVGQPIVT